MMIKNNQYSFTSKRTLFVETIKHNLNKIKIFKVFLILICSLSFQFVSAQWQQPCQDSLRKDRYFRCNEPYFRPVCGCTNKTYRNECVSYNVNGVNIIKNNGVCKEQNFEFDFYPNPVIEQINFALEFFDQGNITIQIIDTYGKLMYFDHRVNVHRLDDIIMVNGFRPGIYVIAVISGNTYKSKKMVVI